VCDKADQGLHPSRDESPLCQAWSWRLTSPWAAYYAKHRDGLASLGEVVGCLAKKGTSVSSACCSSVFSIGPPVGEFSLPPQFHCFQ
jgi:hypothetical protein